LNNNNFSPDNLTETGIGNMRFFLKYLAKHGLIDKACDRLESKDMDKLHVSIEVIKEIQSMVKEYAELSGKINKDDAAVIASSHQHHY